MLELPLVTDILQFHADQPDNGTLIRKDADSIAALFDLLNQQFDLGSKYALNCYHAFEVTLSIVDVHRGHCGNQREAVEHGLHRFDLQSRAHRHRVHDKINLVIEIVDMLYRPST